MVGTAGGGVRVQAAGETTVKAEASHGHGGGGRGKGKKEAAVGAVGSIPYRAVEGQWAVGEEEDEHHHAGRKRGEGALDDGGRGRGSHGRKKGAGKKKTERRRVSGRERPSGQLGVSHAVSYRSS